MSRKFVILWLPMFAALAAVLALCAVYSGNVQQPMEWAAKLFMTAMVAAWIVS